MHLQDIFLLDVPHMYPHELTPSLPSNIEKLRPLLMILYTCGKPSDPFILMHIARSGLMMNMVINFLSKLIQSPLLFLVFIVALSGRTCDDFLWRCLIKMTLLCS